MTFKHKNGKIELINPARIAGVLRGELPDELIIKTQLDELQAEVDAIEAGGITITEVQLADGTVLLPSLTYTNDLNTGLYRIGADNIGVTAGGAKVLDIATTGLSVVGTTTSSGAILASATTDATTKDTGSIITEGGIGVEKAIFAGTSITATTSVITDTIAEKTLDAGVTIDGVVLSDSSVALADGLVSDLAIKLGADANNGIYGVSDTQLGIAVEGVLVGGANTTGLFTDSIVEQTTSVGVTVAGVLAKSGGITSTIPNIYKGVTSITAFATGGQASATVLTGEFNEVTVCATAGDSVKLPTPVLGTVINVKNAGANYSDVFGQTGATIDGGSANTASRLQPGQTMQFKANSTTAWVSNNPASFRVSQGTNISTGVTANAIRGVITTQSASAAAGATNTFTVTNSFCQADSHVAVYVMDYAGAFLTNGNPVVVCDNRTDGTFDVVIANTQLVNGLNGTLVIGFEIKN